MSLTVQLVIISLTSSLTDVVAADQSLHNINFSDVVRSGRHRRSEPVPLTRKQISDIVDSHNKYRAGEGANNMELMIYDEALAQLAATWTAHCVWRHPHPDDTDYAAFKNYGQNLFLTSAKNINVSAPIKAWFIEKAYYDYDTLGCVAGKMCGHYTQVVWATSRKVGCAHHRCTPMKAADNSVKGDASIFACQYSPPGNYRGQRPYTKGAACSKCGSGAGWCKDRLCNWQCSRSGTDCLCASYCYNCAKLNDETCKCSCADGWYGTDCTVECKDTHEHCNANPGWPLSWCDRSYVRAGCLAMCKVCTPDADAKADQCPPEKGPHAYDQPSSATTFINSQRATMMMLMMLTVVVTISNDAWL